MSWGSLGEARFLCAGAQPGSWTHLDQPWQWQERPSDPRRSEVMTPGPMQLLPPPSSHLRGLARARPSRTALWSPEEGRRACRVPGRPGPLCPLSSVGFYSYNREWDLRGTTCQFFLTAGMGGLGVARRCIGLEAHPPLPCSKLPTRRVRTGRPQFGPGVARLNPNLAARPT